MMPIELVNGRIALRNIDKDDFPVLLQWYSQPNKYKYATGIDKPITPEQLKEKYLETLVNTQEFYLLIYLPHSDCIIGSIRGHIGYERPNQCWITSILIDENYQGKGYGAIAVELLSENLKSKYNINEFFASIIMENKGGINFWLKQGYSELRIAKDYFELEGRTHNALIVYKKI